VSIALNEARPRADGRPVPPPAAAPPSVRSEAGLFPAFGLSKIGPRHLERRALVYVRQSSPQQVLEHRESAALQYGLARRARELGWPGDRVEVIDEDQGRSGSTAEGRLGFQRLLAEVGLDRVGIILGVEMSRLARSCKDWHQLLELCALFGTLLADQDGLYDPTDFNDRLLLGLKGTMSEAELHILRGRMDQGRRNKARRGELFSHPPAGYVRLPSGEMALDPDEQARAVVRLIFDQFDELGTLNAVLRYLVRHGIRLGVRSHSRERRGELEWRRPNRQTLRNLLHHPIYAGAYAYGRRPVDPRRKVPGRPATGRRVASHAQCEVLLQDRLPAYITWERYLANLRHLAENQARAARRGAPRGGHALLAGLLVCGRCGRRMLVAYSGPGRRLTYRCSRGQSDYGAPPCQSLAGRGLNECVARQVLQALAPAALELSLAAADAIEAERARLGEHWRQRRERAAYEAERAARQYHAVEPENRLVARELERRWEEALAGQRDLQEAYQRFAREQPTPLGALERAAIQDLAGDIPALWGAAGTSASDRQEVVRHLVERVIVAVEGDSERVGVTVHWAGGYTSRQEILRPVARYEQAADYPRLLARVGELRAEGRPARAIADCLNREGWRPPKRRATFTAGMVRQLAGRLEQPGPRPRRERTAGLLGEHEWWFDDLARALGMPQPTLYSWIRRGWVHARQLAGGAQGRWVLWADAEECERLRRLRTCPRSWETRPTREELIVPKARPKNR
jgi:DNA invertase Pin-like site-specific DNA recombinase